jgi:hypothetical protein
LQGDRVVVEEFLRRLDGDIKRVCRREIDGVWWARAAVQSGNPLSALQSMMDEGVDRGLSLSTTADLDELMTIFEIPYEMRPNVEGEADWRQKALAVVRDSLLQAEIEVIHVDDTSRMPIDATGPTEVGQAVGFVVIAVNDPIRLEAVGVVRDDSGGTLRIEPRTQPWEGPWMGR